MRGLQALIVGSCPRVVLAALALVLVPAVASPDTGAVDPRPELWTVTFDGGDLTASRSLLARHVTEHVSWLADTGSIASPSLALDVADDPTPAGAQRPAAFEYSDAYNVRRKIHFYASFATLPLFVTQAVLGQKLYDYTGDSGVRSAHTAVATSVAVLFGVNSVTGVWNLVESRKDPNKRTKRLVHGILMLAADAGFVATGVLAPDEDEGGGSRGSHRAVAYASMATAVVGYMIMLFDR
jgi:hypothetical protein